jgi:protein-disulfide isomerase
LLDEITAGQVQFVLIPVTFIGPGAGNAARGALCAGEQGKFWEMHDTLFYWQGRYLGSVFSERRIRMGAENLGLDMAAFDQCMDADQPVLEAARTEFDRRGLTGTPSLFINGEKVRDYQELENLQPED